MAVYKEEKTGTWRVIYRYTDWTGEKKQTQKGNCYTCCDERWVLEFYWEHRNDSVEELATSVMKNEQMWGRDLTEIPGFLAATIENLQKIRNQGALSAYRDCI